MMPPLVRRCPECGTVALRGRFRAVAESDEAVAETEPGRRLLECPSCGAHVDVTAEAWLT